eukprot:TRINITY_DN2384_c0_g1_i1.p1 TRINITY_DN2384_c0_g1~~TRINITY_DN2384_c0_g1_i1.p1  ORF type:complete len:315 (-),score=76.29 TRINITY_DN2384_c0_g1_i1:57-1001(-)
MFWLPFILLLVATASEAKKLNLRPIIGIVAEPDDDVKPTCTVMDGNYVRWLTAAGARIAVVRSDYPENELRTLFSSINGLLFTGGSRSLDADTPYFKTASLLFDLVKQANNNGDYFPVWGTCMGFQLLSILGAQDHSILDPGFDSYNLTLPLMLTPLAKESRIFNTLSSKTVTTLTTQNATQNLHHYGIDPSHYSQNSNLATIYRLLSTNTDRAGRPFASTLEGIKYPIYGTQWHGERNQFAWGVNEGLDKSPAALHAMQDVANFFVGESRKNFHQFATPLQEQANLIYQWEPTYTGDQGNYPEEEMYYFPLVQ